jgi:hypothetical protein
MRCRVRIVFELDGFDGEHKLGRKQDLNEAAIAISRAGSAMQTPPAPLLLDPPLLELTPLEPFPRTAPPLLLDPPLLAPGPAPD